MGKKRVGRYGRDFREMAVRRMKDCSNIAGLARELGVHRTVLYQWRDQVGARPEQTRESQLERENQALKLALADKVLEADFFGSALQKVEARRQSSRPAGETASTTESGS